LWQLVAHRLCKADGYYVCYLASVCLAATWVSNVLNENRHQPLTVAAGQQSGARLLVEERGWSYTLATRTITTFREINSFMLGESRIRYNPWVVDLAASLNNVRIMVYCRIHAFLIFAPHLFVLLVVTSTTGQTMRWQRVAHDPGSWNDTANWCCIEPGFSPQRFWEFVIDDGGVAELLQGSTLGSAGKVGERSNATLRQSGGSLEVQSELALGYHPNARGVFQLTDGSATVSELLVGFLGQGELRIDGGVLSLNQRLNLGGGQGGVGSVIQTSGIVRPAEGAGQFLLGIGFGGYGEGRYELSGNGQLQSMSIVIDRGGFDQLGGSVVVDGELSLQGINNATAEYRLNSDLARLTTRSLLLKGGAVGPGPKFLHEAGVVESQYVNVDNGDYTLNKGKLSAEAIYVGSPTFDSYSPQHSEGVFVQNSGLLTADSITIEGATHFNGKTSAGRLELNGGTTYVDRLAIRSSSLATLQQNGGRLFVNNLELEGQAWNASQARFSMYGGRVIVNDSFIAATRLDEVAELDFHDQRVVVQTGIGSQVLLGPGLTIHNGSQAGLLIGGDSVLGLTDGFDIRQLLGSIIHHNVVTFTPGGAVTIKTGQRAQIGSEDVWNAGLIADGFAYDSPVRGDGLIQGSFVVTSQGNVRLDDFRSRVIVNGLSESGVLGGSATLNELMVAGTEGSSKFVIDADGHLTVNDLLRVVDNQSIELLSGRLSARTMRIGLGGSYFQSGGSADFHGFEVVSTATGGPGGRGSGQLHAGQLTAHHFLVNAGGQFRQTGGEVVADVFAVDRYFMADGTLTIRSEMPSWANEGTIDLANTTSTIHFEGAIGDLGDRFPFSNVGRANLNVDRHSLLLVPPSTDVTELFGTVNNAGIIHDRSQPLVIPSDREIHGAGDLTRQVPSLEIHGKLIGEPGSIGLWMAKFHVFPGAEVDLTYGGVWSYSHLPSRLSGGSLRANQLAIDTDGVFLQSGGDAVFRTILARERSSYRLAGGTLTIQDEWNDGQLDFDDSAATLVLDAGAHINLQQVDVVKARAATLVGGADSLIITDAANLPESRFASFSTEGLVHLVGSVLEVPAAKTLTGEVTIEGGIINAGTVRPGREIGPIYVRAGDFLQSALGRLEIEIADHRMLPSSSNGIVADALGVAGTVTLDGTLVVQLREDFVLAAGDQYGIIAGNQIVGEFSSVQLPEILPGLKWNLLYGSQSVHLEVLAKLPLDEIPLGDFNENGLLDAADIDALTAQINTGDYHISFDVNGDSFLDDEDHRLWIEEQSRTIYGDADFNGTFASADLVQVLQAGEYEDFTTGNSTWATGDWDGDLEFGTSDLVTAIAAGGYEQPPAIVQAVPEANLTSAFAMGLAGLLCRLRGTSLAPNARTWRVSR
jgi:hypothetical protein